LADVPASQGARYGRSSGSGDQPTRQQYQPNRYQPPVVPQRPPVQQRQAGAGYPPPAPRRGQDDGWDAPTQHVSSSAYAGASAAGAATRAQPALPTRTPAPGYSPPPSTPGYVPSETRVGTRRAAATDRADRAPERGLPGWLAVLIIVAIAGIGGGIDIAQHSQVKGGFNVSVVVAAVVAIILVRRSSMFSVVVAPPLVYFVESAIFLYIKSGGLHDRKVLLDAAANWLVYGFPAIAGATAAVLIIAGIRLIAGR
jgi:hypothetical protein